MGRLVFFVVVVSALLLAATAWANWSPGDFVGSDTSVEEVNVGDVGGIAGAINPWSESMQDQGMNGGWMCQEGSGGVHWSGQQFERVEILDDKDVDTVGVHNYVEANGRTRIRVELTADACASGAACVLFSWSPGWKWHVNVELDDTKPLVTATDHETGLPVELSTTDSNSYEHVGFYGTGSKSSPGQLETLYATRTVKTGASLAGVFVGSTAAISTDDYDAIQVTYSIHTKVDARRVDNGNVSDWKYWIEATFMSTIY